MHEIARHWRLREHRLRLTCDRRELEDGTVQFKLPGSSNWVEARSNGHHRDENPLVGAVIYQAPEEPIAIDLPKEVEIALQTE